MTYPLKFIENELRRWLTCNFVEYIIRHCCFLYTCLWKKRNDKFKERITNEFLRSVVLNTTISEMTFHMLVLMMTFWQSLQWFQFLKVQLVIMTSTNNNDWFCRHWLWIPFQYLLDENRIFVEWKNIRESNYYYKYYKDDYIVIIMNIIITYIWKKVVLLTPHNSRTRRRT